MTQYRYESSILDEIPLLRIVHQFGEDALRHGPLAASMRFQLRLIEKVELCGLMMSAMYSPALAQSVPLWMPFTFARAGPETEEKPE